MKYILFHICRDQLQKKKVGVKKCREIMSIKGGWGVQRLMEKSILNFHFDYLTTSHRTDVFPCDGYFFAHIIHIYFVNKH